MNFLNQPFPPAGMSSAKPPKKVVTAFGAETPRTIVDELIYEQRSLTAVSRFAQKHERAELPLQSRFYRDLITLPAGRR